MEEEALSVQPNEKKRRFWELDFLRGLCVILMVFDHFMYSIYDIMPRFNDAFWADASAWVGNVYWYGMLRIVVRFIVLFCFFLICGISCTLSRSNIKRGALCFLVGCGITFFTVVADAMLDMDIAIYFGVLHMLGVSMMLYGLIDKLGQLIAKIGKDDKTKKATRIIGDYLAPTVGLILFIVYFAGLKGGVEGDTFVTDIGIEDQATSVFASLFIDVKYAWSIGGADYWPLLPWGAIVLIGGFIGRGLYHSKAKDCLAPLDGKWNKPVCFVGRHALIVYVLHQVVAFVLLYLITLIAA